MDTRIMQKMNLSSAIHTAAPMGTITTKSTKKPLNICLSLSSSI